MPIAIDNSLKNQTYNTPAICTWCSWAENNFGLLNGNGGTRLGRQAHRDSSQRLYSLGRSNQATPPFRHRYRQSVRRSSDHHFSDGTSTLRSVAKALRANGIVDTELVPQNPAATSFAWPCSPPSPRRRQRTQDCIDWVVEQL